MSRNGVLHRNSVPGKLAKFFADNPDEELTCEQASVKFDVSLRSVQMAVLRAAMKGELEYVRVIRMPAKGRAGL